MTTRSGRNHPSFEGAVGSVTALKIVLQADRVAEYVQLMGPGTWGTHPVKSMAIASSSTVTRTRIGSWRSRLPSPSMKSSAS